MESGPLIVGRFAILLLALYAVGLSFSVSAESARDSPKTGGESGGSGNEIDHWWVCGRNRPLAIAVARTTGAIIAL